MNKRTTISRLAGTAGILAIAAIRPSNAGTIRPAILIDDFEYETWESRDWGVTGEAFGRGPAAGTLEGQMEVGGYEGERMVNSFHAGSGPGTLLLAWHHPSYFSV